MLASTASMIFTCLVTLNCHYTTGRTTSTLEMARIFVKAGFPNLVTTLNQTLGELINVHLHTTKALVMADFNRFWDVLLKTNMENHAQSPYTIGKQIFESCNFPASHLSRLRVLALSLPPRLGERSRRPCRSSKLPSLPSNLPEVTAADMARCEP